MSTNNYQQRGGSRGEQSLSIAPNIPNYNATFNEQQRGINSQHHQPNIIRPNSSKMPYVGTQSQILQDSKTIAAIQQFKNNAGKPPKAINQSMQNPAKNTLISLENIADHNTTHLDLSVDSISNNQLSRPALIKHTINIASTATLRSNLEQLIKQQNAPQQLQVLHQEVSNCGSQKQTPAQGGGVTEGGIKGRKIDNPHLVIVKELKEQEEFDNTMRANNIFKNGGIPRRSRMQEDLLNISLLNNSGFIGLYKPIQEFNNKQRTTKSQENRRNKSKERKPAAAPLSSKQIEMKFPQQIKPFVKSGTKSTRDTVKTTSLGHNELMMNELLIVDQQTANSQLGQGQAIDFKNRTHYDILKQVNNEDIKSGGIQMKKGQKIHELAAPKLLLEQRQQSRSRSRDKKINCGPIKILAQNQISAIMPKSIHPKERNQVQNNQNIQNEPKKLNSTSHAHTDASADKSVAATTSFIQQDHGRCVTSQGLAHSSQHNLLSLNTNGRTLSQPNLIKSTASKSSRFILQTDSSHPTDSGTLVHKKNRQQQSSPERSTSQIIKSNVPGIDRLVKKNLIKMRSKMEEEKILRQQSEERQRKKKEMLDISNNMVRKHNKDKTYKQVNSTINAIGNQQSQDYIISTSNPTTIDYPGPNPKIQCKKLDLKLLKQQINLQKLSQSQKIDFNIIHETKVIQQVAQQHQPFQHKISTNHRKSYGLEFIDIKKEINEELKTIEYRHNHFPQKEQVNATKTIPWEESNQIIASN